MKKSISIVIYISLMIFMIACSADNEHYLGQSYDISVKTLVEKIEKKDSFILKFDLSNCSSCTQFKIIEDDYLKKHNLSIYNISLDKDSDSFLNSKEYMGFFDKEFHNLIIKPQVPKVYWIADGKIKDELEINYNGSQESLIDKWVLENGISEK